MCEMTSSAYRCHIDGKKRNHCRVSGQKIRESLSFQSCPLSAHRCKYRLFVRLVMLIHDRPASSRKLRSRLEKFQHVEWLCTFHHHGSQRFWFGHVGNTGCNWTRASTGRCPTLSLDMSLHIVLLKIIQPSINTVSALMAAASIPLPTHLPSIPSMSVCGLMKSYLAERTDTEAVWMISENQKFYQITFCVNFGFVSDRTLQDLVHLGIGTRKDTRVFVLPTAVILQQQTNEKRESVLSLNSTTDMNHSHDSSPNHDETDIQPMASDPTFSNRIRKRINESNFKKSVRARLMVHQVVASIRASSAITFDFVLLICLASMLAAFGLLENSTVIIVASMLVSPLMNPIMGIVFGLSIRDHALWRRGLRNEIIGLIICISCGFILG